MFNIVDCLKDNKSVDWQSSFNPKHWISGSKTKRK